MEATQEDLYLETSQQYIGQWNKLVSTTNWEKGAIILHWRQDLIARGAPVAEYSDDAWSRRVGNVSPQHVGRLRRVAERFGNSRDEFGGLYWSHFQAAIDWEDAEMWLEGAIQNTWSVAQMKNQRWEALGAPEDKKPRDEDIITGELDEDVDATIDGVPKSTVEPSVGVVQQPEGESEDGDTTPWDEADGEASGEAETSVDAYDDAPAATADAAPKVPLFDKLPSLPEDLADAVEAFKLAIIRHKLLSWEEINRDDVLGVLEALKALALQPAEE